MKRLFSIIILAVTAIAASAQSISEQQARDRALQYMTVNGPLKARGLAVDASRLKSAKVEAKGIYAFNVVGGGFVIASGDSRALPVLGYSNSGSIDWEQMPDNMRAWLKQYDRAIETLGGTKDFTDGVFQDFMNGIFQRGKQKTRASKAAIQPLIKTKWNQLSPYYDQCPLYDGANTNWKGKRCVTGCVATAMAQVMNYYQWPQSACKQIPAYDQETAFENKKKTWHHDALSPVSFDWKNMSDTYGNSSTKAQREAVATLMKYCGQAVYMQYTPEGSGSNHQQVVEALVKYFGYEDGAFSANRIKYTIDEWEDLIYDELAAGRPVQYGGSSDDAGHSFVCDGYDGNGYFHINWGWGGSDDNYFSLAVLNPYNNTSAGSGSSGLGYCMDQMALVNVKPAEEGYQPKKVIPDAYLFELEPVKTFAADSVGFTYAFISYTYNEILVDFAFGTREADGTLTPIYKGDPADTIVYNVNYNYHEAQIDSTRFEPGESQVLYPMVRFYNLPDSDWQMLGSKEFHVTAGRTPEGKFFLYKNVPQLEIKKAAITKGPGRIGVRNDLTITVHNNGEESTMPLYLVPFYFGSVKPSEITNDTPYTQGEPMLCGAFLKAGVDSDVTYCFKPMRGGTIYLLLALPDGTSLAYTIFEMSEEMGSYEEYVVNNSWYEMQDVYEGDYQPMPTTDAGIHPGHLVYHVSFADNPNVNIPYGQPSDNIYLYAVIKDKYDRRISSVRMEEKLRDYLRLLPEKADKGSWKLNHDLVADIRRGGRYVVRSYFNEWLNQAENQYVLCCNSMKEFSVLAPASIRLEGDTIVASGQPLHLEIHLNSGFPYNPKVYTGLEKARYTLYEEAADGTLTERSAGKTTLTFNKGQDYLAVVDTMTVNGSLPDGNYLLRVDTNVKELGSRDIHIAVGATAIDRIPAESQAAIFTDLQGRRLQGRPSRKGIYIRNGRKEIVK